MILSCMAIIIIGIIAFISKKELSNGYFSTVKLQFLKNYFKDNYLEEVNELKGQEGIYIGYVDALDNVNTYYLDEDMLRYAEADEEGNSYGVGLELMWSLDESYLLVVGVEENSPAAEADIKIGDFVVKVGELKTIPSNRRAILDLIYGASQDKVMYEVQRGEKHFQMALTPRKIIVNDLEEKQMENILYVKLNSIKEGTSKKLEIILEKSKVKGLILDIRDLATDNMEEISKITDLFLDQGTSFKVKTKKEGVITYETMDGAYKLPMVLIMNAATSRGAEALAEALRDRAQSVGSNTAGNPYVRKIVPLGDGTGVSVASGIISDRYGTTLPEEGIEPDERLYISEEEKLALLNKGSISQEEDSYLQNALKKLD